SSRPKGCGEGGRPPELCGRRRREALAGRAGSRSTARNLGQGRRSAPQDDFYNHLRRQPARDALLVDSRDVDDTLARAAQVVKATYVHPYQMHGSVGTSCAVADVSGDKATVWSATQSAYPTRSGIALLLGLPADN